jgi:arylsulfatase A-like enzyme
MTSPHEPVVPSAEFKGKSGIAPIADFVMETDWSAGQVIKALEDAGVAENTLVIFTADNGHSHYTGWEDLINAGHYPSGPFRGHKADIWEGGHRVPFVVRWPGQIPAGTSDNQLVCLTDIFATLADLLEKDIPANAAADSYSFLPALRMEADTSQRMNMVHHSVHGEFAYRQGPWKIIYQMPEETRQASRGKKTTVRLYNLREDVSEQHDVSTQYPDLVHELTAALDTIIENGRSTAGLKMKNDVKVDFRTIQPRRWMAE